MDAQHDEHHDDGQQECDANDPDLGERERLHAVGAVDGEDELGGTRTEGADGGRLETLGLRDEHRQRRLHRKVEDELAEHAAAKRALRVFGLEPGDAVADLRAVLLHHGDRQADDRAELLGVVAVQLVAEDDRAGRRPLLDDRRRGEVQVLAAELAVAIADHAGERLGKLGEALDGLTEGVVAGADDHRAGGVGHQAEHGRPLVLLDLDQQLLRRRGVSVEGCAHTGGARERRRVVHGLRTVDLDLPLDADRRVLRRALVGGEDAVVQVGGAHDEQHPACDEEEQWCQPELQVEHRGLTAPATEEAPAPCALLERRP